MTAKEIAIYRQMHRTFGDPPELTKLQARELVGATNAMVNIMRLIYDFYTNQRGWKLEQLAGYASKNLLDRVSKSHSAPLRPPSWHESASKLSDEQLVASLDLTANMSDEERRRHLNSELVDMVPVPIPIKRMVAWTDQEELYIMRLCNANQVSDRTQSSKRWRTSGREMGTNIVALLERVYGKKEVYLGGK